MIRGLSYFFLKGGLFRLGRPFKTSVFAPQNLASSQLPHKRCLNLREFHQEKSPCPLRNQPFIAFSNITWKQLPSVDDHFDKFAD